MSEAKQLKWEPGDKFTLTGEEFSQMHNSLKFIVESTLFLEQARQIAAIGQMYELSLKKLNEGIESGIVKEVIPEAEVIE